MSTGAGPPRSPKLRPGPALGPVFVAEYKLLLRSVCTRGRLIASGTPTAVRENVRVQEVYLGGGL